MFDLALLTPLRRFSDGALLLMRVAVGLFLMWGVWDNIVSAEHMRTFVEFQRKFGFAYPELLAPLSVYGQFFAGLAIALGLFSRWAGLVIAFNFAVAIAMVDGHGGLRGSLASGLLLLMGLYWATRGGGRYAIDALLERRWRGQGASSPPRSA